jgi:hypothetical protein
MTPPVLMMAQNALHVLALLRGNHGRQAKLFLSWLVRYLALLPTCFIIHYIFFFILSSFVFLPLLKTVPSNLFFHSPIPFSSHLSRIPFPPLFICPSYSHFSPSILATAWMYLAITRMETVQPSQTWADFSLEISLLMWLSVSGCES